jgi:hypothetical protein
MATLLYHGIRREELCGLRVKDLHSRQGVMHIRVKGKRSKIRFIPVNPAAQGMIEDYLALTGHRSDIEGALFRPMTPLRAKYIRDLVIRGRSKHTQEAYIRYVCDLARYYRRSSELISYEVTDWLFHLMVLVQFLDKYMMYKYMMHLASALPALCRQYRYLGFRSGGRLPCQRCEVELTFLYLL